MYTLEYADGYYIAKNGVGVINFDNPEDRDFAEFVLAALNNADGECKKCHIPLHVYVDEKRMCMNESCDMYGVRGQ